MMKSGKLLLWISGSWTEVSIFLDNCGHGARIWYDHDYDRIKIEKSREKIATIAS